MRRLLKILNGVVITVLMSMIALSTVMAIMSHRSPDGAPTMMGRKLLSVSSGSMEPTIHTGDVIIIDTRVGVEQIRDSDVITYRTRENADMLITHRVIGTVQINGKNAAYVTKGDANSQQDYSTVSPDQLVGRYEWRIPYLGYISRFMRTVAGILLVVVLPGVVLIGLELYKVWRLISEAETARARGGAEQPK